ncbi:MAG TPA: 1-acyl-sn-glycerol-3-phosphate acyltransferase [Candidatus Lokiarchaeia archaeon]|nr:1-acyl-sn-glycerol-3-phosphate acyltransferase [Candidatus Lokiarchaeia archaeon]
MMPTDHDAAIPHPEYASWMHERIPLQVEAPEDRAARWQRQPRLPLALDAVVSRFVKHAGLFHAHRKWVFYAAVLKFFAAYLRIFNRKRVYGRANVPRRGAIIYVNHISSFDPFVLFTSMPKPFCGSLMSWGNGWFADAIDRAYGLVAFKGGDSRAVKVEKMVRSILLKNTFFAIAPEGFVAREFVVHQGFSSIAEVYATVNALRDAIPLLPVLIRGGEPYRSIKPNTSPIDIHFFPPFFLPRAWLQRPEEGGKTPREITDYVMRRLARCAGQETFVPNPRLEKKKMLRAGLVPPPN